MDESKKIGLLTSTAIVVGNMIASGLFMLPATLGVYGGISLVGWLISGAATKKEKECVLSTNWINESGAPLRAFYGKTVQKTTNC